MLNTPPLLSLRVRANRDYLSAATTAVREIVKKLALSESDIDRVVLALEEALDNTIEYGFGDHDEMLHVQLRCSVMGVELSVTARCLPLDQERLPRYDPNRIMHTGDASGLNLLLMKKMMDRVEFSIQGDLRKTTMLKRLSAPLKPPVLQQMETTVLDVTDIHVRPTRPDDANNLALLAFRSHGSVFFSEHIYYPERIREMIQTGEMISVVLDANDGEIVGHAAMLFAAPGAKTAELTYAFIDPRCRRLGGVTLMLHALEKQAKEMSLLAIYALAVTNHPYSQRPLNKDGFKESCLLLETSPATNQWHRNTAGAVERISNIAFLKHLLPPDAAPLYPPAHHKTMIKHIYEHLGLTPEFLEAHFPLQTVPASAGLDIAMDLKEGWMLIEIKTYGKDAAARIAGQIPIAREQGLFTIQLILPLWTPETAMLTTEFETLGFFFSGVIVCNNGREGILLQYILSERTDYEQVHVETVFSQQLVDYIKACDPRES